MWFVYMCGFFIYVVSLYTWFAAAVTHAHYNICSRIYTVIQSIFIHIA